MHLLQRITNILFENPISSFFGKGVRLFYYFGDMWTYSRMPGAEKLELRSILPKISDKTSVTQISYSYFYQDTWGAEKVFQTKPNYHVDIGSTALLVGILAGYTRVCSVDVRPLPVTLPNLEAKKGSVTALPFYDASIDSLSSLCVLEHIGLGRYGDEFDPNGTITATKEIQRVMKKGGNIFVSTMVGQRDFVRFNAHRVFTLDTFCDYFKNCALKELKIIYGDKMHSLEEFQKDKPEECVGLFHFVKK